MPLCEMRRWNNTNQEVGDSHARAGTPRDCYGVMSRGGRLMSAFPSHGTERPRQPTPRPNSSNPFSGLPNRLRGSSFLPRRHPINSEPLSPIFSESEDDPLFPSETLPPILEESLFCAQLREQFEQRLRTFPEIPLEAHRRIFGMGNEIIDCYEVRLERYCRGSLLDCMSGCVAVFTFKERTGQRWLMVFKQDGPRTMVKFNRLLTHSLTVNSVSPTAIEMEAARPKGHAVFTPPVEMCVITFRTPEDVDNFLQRLHDAQATPWNRREVNNEQQIKFLIAASQGLPRPRTPFTINTPITVGKAPVALHKADLDDNWRRRENRDEQEIHKEELIRTIKEKWGCGDADWRNPSEKRLFQAVARIFAKIDDGFDEIANGTLEIVDHGQSALNELKLLQNGDEIMQQFIYKWNVVEEDPEDPSGKSTTGQECAWTGAATLSHDHIPERGEFKAMFLTVTDKLEFVQAFQHSLEKAGDDSLRKRHIRWVLQSKAKREDTNGGNGDSI